MGRVRTMKERSLDAPLKAGVTLTLKDLLSAPEEDFVFCSALPKVKIPQARRSIEINQDVTEAFRKRFGNMPLGRALRVLLGLKPKIAQNAWQEEEDELLKKYYPKYGSKYLAEALDRKWYCIGIRASKLGIKRVWTYKRITIGMMDRLVRRASKLHTTDLKTIVNTAMKEFGLPEEKAERMAKKSIIRIIEGRALFDRGVK